MGTRRIKKNSKQKKIEKKENEKIADENHTYYVGMVALRVFADSVTKLLKIRAQIEKEIKDFKINEELLNAHFEWHDTINRLLNFFTKKYPESKKDKDFTIMDKVKKVNFVFFATKNIYQQNYNLKYKKSILKVNKYDEGRYLELKLLDLLAIMEVAEECFYSSHLNMDINERKTVRTIITKYKKGIKDKIIYNFDLNVQKMKGVI